MSKFRARPGPGVKCVKYMPVKFSAHRGPPPSLSKRGGRRAPRASLALARRRASTLNRPKTRPTAAKRDRTPEPPPCSFSVVRSTPTASLENRASSRAPSPCTLRASRSTSAHAQCPQRLGPGSQASHGPTAVHAPHMRTPIARPTEDGTLMSWPHYWRHAGSTYTHTPTTRPTADGTLTSRDCTGPGLAPPPLHSPHRTGSPAAQLTCARSVHTHTCMRGASVRGASHAEPDVGHLVQRHAVDRLLALIITAAGRRRRRGVRIVPASGRAAIEGRDGMSTVLLV